MASKKKSTPVAQSQQAAAKPATAKEEAPYGRCKAPAELTPKGEVLAVCDKPLLRPIDSGHTPQCPVAEHQ